MVKLCDEFYTLGYDALGELAYRFGLVSAVDPFTGVNEDIGNTKERAYNAPGELEGIAGEEDD